MTAQITADWLMSDASQRVCRMLTTEGHEAWFVGGCVRNALIGAPVADLDLSTSARPDETLALAERAGLKAIPTGIDHGTVTVLADGIPYEVTTFRKDVATDGRRAVVAFAKTMTEDARRRDFTMNALYADQDGVVADPLGGLPDLEARQVRFIEDPDQRIKEDYLRILRFFRFHAWYGDADAGIEPDGLAACADNVEGIATLSRERIGQEMMKLLSAPDPAPAVASFAACGGLAQALPGADAGFLAPLVHFEEQLDLEPDPVRRLAIIGGVKSPERLRLSKSQARRMNVFLEYGLPTKTAYHHGSNVGRGVLAVLSAMTGQPINKEILTAVDRADDQMFPVRADDLKPKYQNRALGEKLQELEDLWCESGFTLTKDDLLG
ncbi:MAG: CCA tRNA nucleotidyltransferase [Pseudomonadota bacterium]